METPRQKNFLFDVLLPQVERLGWLVTVLGLGLYYATVPKSSPVLVIGILTLATAYFIGAFTPAIAVIDAPDRFTYEPVTVPVAHAFTPVVLRKIQGIASAITLVGILFKLLFFSGSASLLQIGVVTLAALLVAQLATKGLSRPATILMLFGAATWVLPTETLVRHFYQHNPVLAEKMLYSIQHPKDRAAAAEVRQLRRTQDSR